MNMAMILGILVFLYGVISSIFAIVTLLLRFRSIHGSGGSTSFPYTLIVIGFFKVFVRLLLMPPIGLILFFQGWRLDPILQFAFWLFAFVVLAESLTVDSARALAKLVKSKRVDAIIPVIIDVE